MKKKNLCLLISLLLIVIGSVISYQVDTDWGQIETTRIKINDKDGFEVSANLYIPKSATSQSPAPAMIISPGGDCPSDLASPWASELARRGYVVAAADYSGSGDTQVNPSSQYFGSNGSMSLDTIYDYLANCSFVDSEQIGVGGHSMGSLYSYRLALQRKVSLVISDVLFTDEMPDYNFNFFQISATHDEGILARLNTFDDIYKDAFLTQLFNTETIVPEQIYGSFDENNVRVMYTLNQTHQDDMISTQFISRMLDCVTQTMAPPNPISSDNLIYGWKIAGLAIAIIGLCIFLFSLSGILIESSLFNSLVLTSEPKNIGFQYKSKNWWLYFAIMALIPLVTFFFGTAAGNKMASNNLFKLGTTPNGYMVWTLFSSVLLIIAFLIFHYTYGKKNGGNLETYGFSTTSGKSQVRITYLIKAILLAVTIFLCGYFLLLLIFKFANTDLHLWTLSIRPLNSEKLSTLPWYFIAYIPYFALFILVGNSLGFKENTKKSKSIIIGTCVGLIGITILFIVYEILLRFTAIGPFTTANFAHFYMVLLENVIPTFALCMGLALYINKKLHSNYTGIILGALIMSFCSVSSNCLAMVI